MREEHLGDFVCRVPRRAGLPAGTGRTTLAYHIPSRSRDHRNGTHPLPSVGCPDRDPCDGVSPCHSATSSKRSIESSKLREERHSLGVALAFESRRGGILGLRPPLRTTFVGPHGSEANETLRSPGPSALASRRHPRDELTTNRNQALHPEPQPSVPALFRGAGIASSRSAQPQPTPETVRENQLREAPQSRSDLLQREFGRTALASNPTRAIARSSGASQWLPTVPRVQPE